jgi:capsule polysaccharide modification protein KpsS
MRPRDNAKWYEDGEEIRRISREQIKIYRKLAQNQVLEDAVEQLRLYINAHPSIIGQASAVASEDTKRMFTFCFSTSEPESIILEHDIIEDMDKHGYAHYRTEREPILSNKGIFWCRVYMKRSRE